MKNILGIILSILGVGILWSIDMEDRLATDLPHHYSIEEANFFYRYKTVDESQEVIKANWHKKEYQFPREEIKSIIYYPNTIFISRIFSKKLNEVQTKELIEIINTPSNFTWGETTWGIAESDYFFRFFNKENKEIGKLWVCFDECGMTEIMPWTPATKYGGLSEEGKIKFAQLTNSI